MAEDQETRQTFDTKNDGLYAVLHVIAMFGSIVFVIGSVYLVTSDMVSLHGQTTAAELVDFSAKLKFTFRYTHPSVAFLLFMVFNVISKRIFGNEYKLAGLDPQVQNQLDRSRRLGTANAILQNSLEQFLINVFSQLALITYLTEQETLKVIPLLNFLFFVGRITFWLGYPKLRGFGISATLNVNVATVGYVIYKFITVQL